MLIVVMEGTLRIFHFHQVVHFMPDPELPFVMIPNQQCYSEIGRYPLTINSRSMREREISSEKPPCTYRILFLGDSITYGDGIPHEALFTTLMEKILTDATDNGIRYEVLNAGVKGYNTGHEYLFFKSRCLNLQPDLVLVGYCVNDQSPNKIPNQRRLAFSLKYSNQGLWRYIKGSAIYVAGLRFFRNIANATMDLPPWYHDFITQGELTPTLRKKWETSANSLTQLSELCRSKGIEFGIVVFPIKPQFREDYDPLRAQPQGRLKQLSTELGIIYIDLFDAFRQHIEQEIFTDQIHLTPSGHELTAREVVCQLAPVLPREVEIHTNNEIRY
jgi:lysophospholipase L1-like esterase